MACRSGLLSHGARQWIALGQLLRLTDLQRKNLGGQGPHDTDEILARTEKQGNGSAHSPEEKPQGTARLRQGALQGPTPDGERVPSFEAMARHCDPIREKGGIIPGRYPDRIYLFMGFILVTTLSRTAPCFFDFRKRHISSGSTMDTSPGSVFHKHVPQNFTPSAKQRGVKHETAGP